MKHRATTMLLAIGALAPLAGCSTRPWRPPPPAGATWAYSARAARASASAVAAGKLGRVPFGLAIAGGGYKDAPSMRRRDRFWRQQNASKYGFNNHLGQRGEALSPGEAGPRVGQGPAQEPAPAETTPEDAPAPPAETPAPAAPAAPTKGGDR